MFYINYMECKYASLTIVSFKDFSFILTIWNVNTSSVGRQTVILKALY